MGLEGLDLTPQLVIYESNLYNNQPQVILDGNITTCLSAETCPNKGRALYFFFFWRTHMSFFGATGTPVLDFW